MEKPLASLKISSAYTHDFDVKEKCISNWDSIYC